MKNLYLSKQCCTEQPYDFCKHSNKSNYSSVKSLILISSILIISACSSTRTQIVPPIPDPDATTSSETTTEIPSEVSSDALSDLKLCKMHVSNAPTNIGSPKACVSGVELIIAPAPKACLSSGYGLRGGRQHKAIDYQSKPAGAVVAAGDGKIVEVTFRQKDYGNWVIIDHGKGVYTSYAHMKTVEQGLKLGGMVKQGQRLGIMGETGGAAQAIHLHFELREGDYGNPKSWWGLEPLNPFNQKALCS